MRLDPGFARGFAVCYGAYALSQVDLALFAYAVPSIRAELGLSLTGIGWVVALAYALGGLLQVGMGHLTDRFGRARLLTAGVGLAGCFVAAQGAAAGPVTLGLARAGAIATGGAAYPAIGAIVAEGAPARIRGLAIGIMQTAYPLSWLLASLAAVPLLSLYGWRGLFAFALVTVPYALAIRFGVREPARSQASARPELPLGAALRELFSPALRQRTIVLFCANFLFVLAYGGSSLFFPTYFSEARGLALGSSSYLVGLGNGIGILGYLLAAVVGEFLLNRRTTIVVWTLTGAALFLVLVWGTDGRTQMLLAFGAMSMFFYGVAAVKWAFAAETFPTRLRATALAFSGSLAINGGIAVGPVAVSFAVERFGWNWAFTGLIAVPMAASALLYLFLKPLPSGMEVEAVQRAYDKDEVTA